MDSRVVGYRVVRVGAGTVHTRVTVFDHGKLLGQPATRQDAQEIDPVAREALKHEADRTGRRAKIDAADRTWDAICYEDQWTDEAVEYVRRTWVSAEVPVFGTIRMELWGNGELEAKLELIALGNGD